MTPDLTPISAAESEPATFEEIPDEKIDFLVQRITALAESRDMQKFNGIGTLVINGLYGGKIDNWRSRGKKHPAFKKLLQHLALPISSRDLYRAVGTHEMWVRFDKLKDHPLVRPRICAA